MSVSIKKLEHGFTISEVLIAVTILGLIITVIFSAFVGQFASVTRAQVEADLTIEGQNVLRDIVEEVRVGSSVRTTNKITDANQPAGGWNTDSESAILIIAAPATDNSNEFIINPLTDYPYQNELIYFEDSGNLYKRTLAHPLASGNSEMTSCPESQASASCPKDLLLSENYSNLDFTFYDQNNVVTSSPTLGRSIEMNVDISKETFGGSIDVNNNTRISFRNPTTEASEE